MDVWKHLSEPKGVDKAVAEFMRESYSEIHKEMLASQSPVLKVMKEYGDAIRGNWSDFDGRSMKAIIHEWVDYLTGDEAISTIDRMRLELNLCRAGGGHWCGVWGYCDEECGCDGWHGERSE